MATDSAGHIHLLVVGHLSIERDDEKPPGLYHFEWNGSDWSSPGPVYQVDWYPEYPQIVIDRGNQLHATWFTRKQPYEDEITPYKIWYAHGQSQAPAEQPVTLPTATPIPVPEVTPTPTSTPTPTPTPTLDPDLTQVSIASGATETIYTETDDLLLLAKSLLPVVFMIVVVIFGIRLQRR
jgi:hypothetical protein